MTATTKGLTISSEALTLVHRAIDKNGEWTEQCLITFIAALERALDATLSGNSEEMAVALDRLAAERTETYR
jgi:hypothetical protein